jgi:hypothetical protein
VDHTGADLNVVAEEPYEQAVSVVTKSDTLIAFGSSRWASAIRMPGAVYRPMSPPPMTSFGIAYRRDDDSPQLANFLKIVQEVAKRSSTEPPPDGELIAQN